MSSVKYRLSWLRLPFVALVKVLADLRLLDGMPPRSKVFWYGNRISNPLTSQVYFTAAYVYHFLCG